MEDDSSSSSLPTRAEGRASSSRTAAVARGLLSRRAPPPPRQVGPRRTTMTSYERAGHGVRIRCSFRPSAPAGGGEGGCCPAPPSRTAPAGTWRIPAARLFGPCSRLGPMATGPFTTNSRIAHDGLTTTSRFISVSCPPHAHAAINCGAVPANPPLIVRELLAQSRHNLGMLTNRC